MRRFVPSLLAALAACSAASPPIDIERDKIAAAIDAYTAAAIRVGRGEREQRSTMDDRAAYLAVLRRHPDGRRYVDEILNEKQQAWRRRGAVLCEAEQDLSRLSPPPESLNRIAHERYDSDLAIDALARLSTALAQ